DPADLLDHVQPPRLRLVRGNRRQVGEPSCERTDRQLLPSLSRGRDQGHCCKERGEHSPQRTYGGEPRILSLPSSYLLLKQNATELVFLAGLQDGEHLIARLELGLADRDLRFAVARDRDEPRALRQAQLLNRRASARRRFVDLDLDDLEVLL